jgi:hypothetical protein
MKRWVLLAIGVLSLSVVYLQAQSFDFQAAKLFLKAHEDAFEKLRLRTQQMKGRIDKQVFWCKLRVYPKWVKNCVACRLRDEMLSELGSLKDDLKQQALNNEKLAQNDPMTQLIESIVHSMEAELEKYDMLPVVEAVAKRKV